MEGPRTNATRETNNTKRAIITEERGSLFQGLLGDSSQRCPSISHGSAALE